MPLRIAHVTSEPFGPESASGVQQVGYCLARAQAELGHAVAVFSRDDQALHVFTDDGVSARKRGTDGAIRQATSLRQRLLARYLERGLVDDILRWQPHIVHLHSIHIPRNVALAAVLAQMGIPYCVTMHGGLFPLALRRGRLKKRLFAQMFERQYLNDACFLHALNPDEADAARSCGVHARVVVVPNGVPPDAHVAPTNSQALFEAHPALRGRRVFMFIGRLDPWQKGLDLLIEAFAQAGLPRAALVLVGPDFRGSVRMLSELAQRVGISSELVFTGPAFGEHRANLLAGADVFVHPSRWEGLSMAVLGAAAIGKPCLVTRAADPLGALAREGAAVVVDGTLSDIVAGLRRMAGLTSSELLAMGARAKGVADTHFSWRPIASDLVDAYRRAVTADEAIAARSS